MASTQKNSSCPALMAATSNGVWQGDNPVDFALPLLIVQICLVLFVTRTLAMLLRPLRQPHVIAEIIGGVLLGPSVLGKSTSYKEWIFPQQSLPLLETVADLGLLFFLFLVGLELDLSSLKKTGKPALSIAVAGITLPFVTGVGVSIILHETIASGAKLSAFLVFMGVALSITAFPVLARILAERKLLTTEVGQMAMSAAAVNDVVAWILLALAVALSGSGKSPLIALWVLLCGLAFVVFMFTAVKPLMVKIASQTIENEPVNETYVAFTFAAVLVAGFATDAIGIHAIFGAFVFGLIIPKHGPFAGLLIEKIEDLVTILLLPLYFAVSGLKTNIGSIHSAQAGGLLVLVIATACGGKIVGTFLVACLYKMGVRKSLALGFLMNTKGLVELIVLNIGKERKVLNDETFAIMVIMALFTTFITTPMVMWLYKPARNPIPYKRRSLSVANEKVEESKLRILACMHGMPNVHAIINLVEAVRGTRRQTLEMYILHLLELSERSSAILTVQRVRRNGRPFWDSKLCGDGNNVVVAFEAFGRLSKVNVRPMTAISRFADMHEDICATAEDKRTCVIILPFHKHARLINGAVVWEGLGSGLRHVNQRVLRHAPCSVAIFVDRGIGMTSRASSTVDQNIAVLFYGGPDDREALSFGYRMAEHPGVRLTVFRVTYIEPPEDHLVVTMSSTPQTLVRDGSSGRGRLSFSSKSSRGREAVMSRSNNLDWEMEQRQLDEESLALAKGMEGTKVTYEERESSELLEMALAVGKMDGWSFVIVGRGQRTARVTAALCLSHMEYAELGPVGGVLTAAPFSEVQCSVLVVQQYDSKLEHNVSISSKKVKISTPKQKGLLAPNLVVVTESLASNNEC